MSKLVILTPAAMYPIPQISKKQIGWSYFPTLHSVWKLSQSPKRIIIFLSFQPLWNLAKFARWLGLPTRCPRWQKTLCPNCMYNIKRFSRGRQIRITLAGVFGKILGYSMNTLTGPWREIDMDSWMALSPAGIIQLLQVLHFSPRSSV